MRGLLSILTVWLAIGPANAQSGLSDNELFAAYCFGVLEQREVQRQEALTYNCNGSKLCEEAHQQLLKQQRAEAVTISRLRQYLLIKVHGSSSMAVAAVSTVKTNGIQDAKQCADGRVESLGSSYMQCRETCAPQGAWIKSDKCTKCIDQFEPESCRLADRCNDTSRLPF